MCLIILGVIMSKKVKVKLKTFAWDGLELKIPENWEISNAESIDSLVVLTIDDYNINRLIIAIAFGDRYKDDISHLQILEEYLQYVRSGISDFRIVDREIVLAMRHRALKFYWRNGYQGFGFAWKCEHSKKIFTMIAIFKLDEVKLMKFLERSFISSIRCHGAPLKAWSFLDLNFKIPSDFYFRVAEFAKGVRLFKFENDSEDNLFFMKFDLEKDKLKKLRYDSADEFQKFFPDELESKELKMYSLFISPNRIQLPPHEVYFFEGTKKERKFLMKTVFKNLYGYTWLCHQTNSMYVVMIKTETMSKDESIKIIRRVVENTLCHISR